MVMSALEKSEQGMKGWGIRGEELMVVAVLIRVVREGLTDLGRAVE